MTFDARNAPLRDAAVPDVPPNLLNFLLKGWNPNGRKLPRVLPNAASFRKRRDRLSRRFPGEVLVIPTGHEKVRANDTHYRFRPGTDFYYLTGNLEPDCVLVLLPEGQRPRASCCSSSRIPARRTRPSSRIASRASCGWGRASAWSKARRVMSSAASPLTELEQTLKAALTKPNARMRVLRGFSAATRDMVGRRSERPARARQELAAVLSEMRLIKDADEVKELQSAVGGHAARLRRRDRAARDGEERARGRRRLLTRARMEGNDVGYGTIAASGAHACTLHWKSNDGAIRKGRSAAARCRRRGQLALHGGHHAHACPSRGKFTREQRAIYELVLRRAARGVQGRQARQRLHGAQPGRDAVLAQGLERLGILPTSAEEALRDENQFYKRYSLHNVSHMLGLDVHDCAQARAENYKFGKLEAGMVLTVEPGLYFQTDDLTVPATVPRHRRAHRGRRGRDGEGSPRALARPAERAGRGREVDARHLGTEVK